MSEATIEQVRTVARNREAKEYIKNTINKLENYLQRTDYAPDTIGMINFAKGQIEAYQDILTKLY
jgi:predicted RNA-binding protein